jgi:hypothetical protein
MVGRDTRIWLMTSSAFGSKFDKPSPVFACLRAFDMYKVVTVSRTMCIRGELD